MSRALWSGVVPKKGGAHGDHASRVPEGHRSRNHHRSRVRRLQSRCRDARVQDRAHHRNAKYLPLLRGLLRRDPPHARRQVEERHSRGGSRGGRSRSSDLPRNALPQGHHAQGRHQARAPADEAEGAASRLGQVGRHLLGRGDRPDRAAHQDDARQVLRRQERERAGGQSAAARTPTSTTTSSGKSSRPWGCRTGTARPGFDTAPRWPVWPPRSAGGR